MKRVFSIVLVVAMLMSLVSIQGFAAATAASVTIGTTTVDVGTATATVDVTVNTTGTDSKLDYIKIKLDIPEGLTLTGITNPTEYNTGFTNNNTPSTGIIWLQTDYVTRVDVLTSAVFTLTFTIDDPSTEATYNIGMVEGLDSMFSVDMSFSDVQLTLAQAGSVTVGEADDDEGGNVPAPDPDTAATAASVTIGTATVDVGTATATVDLTVVPNGTNSKLDYVKIKLDIPEGLTLTGITNPTEYNTGFTNNNTPSTGIIWLQTDYVTRVDILASAVFTLTFTIDEPSAEATYNIGMVEGLDSMFSVDMSFSDVQLTLAQAGSVTVGEGGNDTPTQSSEKGINSVTVKNGETTATVTKADNTYAATVPYNWDVVDITVVLTDAVKSSMKIDGDVVASGTAKSIQLDSADASTTTATVVVTAEDASTATYYIAITKEAAPAPTLTSIVATPSSFDFEAGTVVTAEKLVEEGLVVKAVYSDSSEDTLEANEYSVEIGDGVATISYEGQSTTVTFTVAAPTLTSIVATPSSFDFEAGTVVTAEKLVEEGLVVKAVYSDSSEDVLEANEYSVEIGDGVATISYEGQTTTVAFTVAPSPVLDSIEVNVETLNFGAGTVVTSELIKEGIIVTAKYTNGGEDKVLEAADYSVEIGDGVATISYTEDDVTETTTVAFTVADPAASTEARLSALTINGVAVEGFAADTTEYEYTVANTTKAIDVVATPADENATSVVVTGADALELGENTITIVVTAEDEATTKTYTITVTRPEAEITAAIKANVKDYVTGVVPYATYDVAEADGVVTITMTELAEHNSAIGAGYWTGFALVAPEGAEYVRYEISDTEEIVLMSLIPVETIDEIGTKGIALYTNAAAPELYVRVQWLDADEEALTSEIAYEMNIDGVKFNWIKAADVIEAVISGEYTENTVTATQADDTITVYVATKGLVAHENASAATGAWTGFALKAPVGAEKVKYAFGATAELVLGDAVALEADVDGEGADGIAFYANASALEPNIYAMVQWCDADGVAVSAPTNFVMDLSGVTLASVSADNNITEENVSDYVGKSNVPADTEDAPYTSIEVNTRVEEDGSISVDISASDVVEHENANGVLGHWVGFAVKAPAGAAKAKYVFATADGANWSDAQILDPLETIDGEGTQGIAFYSNAGAEEPKTVAMVQWFDAEGNAISDMMTFNIDLSGVELYEEEEIGGGTIDNTIVTRPSGGNGGTGTTTPVTPDEPVVTPGEIKFTDLAGYEWAEDAINTLVELEIVNGKSETSFDPAASVTRAEFAKLIVTAFGLTDVAGEHIDFIDIGIEEWYAEYVKIAVANGIVTGYTDGTFKPNATITREEMCVMLERALKPYNLETKESSFADKAEIADWAVPAVDLLSANGIVNGRGDNNFVPKGTATRAESAVIIYRAYLAIADIVLEEVAEETTEETVVEETTEETVEEEVTEEVAEEATEEETTEEAAEETTEEVAE